MKFFFFQNKNKVYIYITTSEMFSPHCVSWLPQLSISSRVFVTVVAVVLELLFFLWLSLSPLARHQDFSQRSKRLHIIFSRKSKKNLSYLKVKWYRTSNFVRKYLLALDLSTEYCIITTMFDNSLHQVWILLHTSQSCSEGSSRSYATLYKDFSIESVFFSRLLLSFRASFFWT